MRVPTAVMAMVAMEIPMEKPSISPEVRVMIRLITERAEALAMVICGPRVRIAGISSSRIGSGGSSISTLAGSMM